jgi:hypothetical protein
MVGPNPGSRRSLEPLFSDVYDITSAFPFLADSNLIFYVLRPVLTALGICPGDIIALPKHPGGTPPTEAAFAAVEVDEDGEKVTLLRILMPHGRLITKNPHWVEPEMWLSEDVTILGHAPLSPTPHLFRFPTL